MPENLIVNQLDSLCMDAEAFEESGVSPHPGMPEMLKSLPWMLASL